MQMGGDGRAQNTTRNQPIQHVGENDVLKTLVRFGEAILKPKLEAARTEAFVSGMQRVASGEAFKEIVDEQPWYSKVFGDTPTIEGARAYTGFAMSQEIATAIEADMPALRQLSPDSFKQVMNERISSINTGDADTNMTVTQSLVKEMPGLMKRHTKEHIGWQQDNLAKA
jgi:hypothetical protein